MHAHDPLWMKVFLAIHIAAGATAFLLAPVALVTAKGGKQHKRWGMVYLWSMGVVAATAVPMAFFFPVRFLALVAVFSFYFGVFGVSRAAVEGAGARRKCGADRLDRRRGDVFGERGAGVDVVVPAARRLR